MYPKRPYSTEQGRFMTRDRIGEAGGINTYAFIVNATPNAIDPMGYALFAFDGTWNEAAEPDLPRMGDTHVVRLHAGYIGTRHYFPGVGTTLGTHFIGALTGAGVGARVDAAWAKLAGDRRGGDLSPVDIVGFSRGATAARVFANMINDRGDPLSYQEENVRTGPPGRNARYRSRGIKGCELRVRFLGIFDTVAAMGFAWDSSNPTTNLRIPGNVDSTRHAIARHERRSAFRVTGAAGAGVQEKWFDGVHADIGGGYRQDTELSMYPLAWMADEGTKSGLQWNRTFSEPPPCVGNPNCGPNGEWPGHNSSSLRRQHPVLKWWEGVEGSRAYYLP